MALIWCHVLYFGRCTRGLIAVWLFIEEPFPSAGCGKDVSSRIGVLALSQILRLETHLGRGP